MAIAGLGCCMVSSAQFHPVTPHTARYRIERFKQGTAGKEIEKATPAENSADTASEREQWIDGYLSVSYPLRKIEITSGYGERRDPFTGKK